MVGGPSLGANASLEVAAAAPDRVRGLLIQMPVLDNALLGCALAFTPLLVGLTFGAPVARLAGRGARLVPRGISHLGDSLLDWMGQDPKPSASVLQGLFFGRVAPPAEERRTHAPADARDRSPAGPRAPVLRLRHAGARDAQRPASIEANSIQELWTKPERLTGKIVPVHRAVLPSPPRRQAATPARAAAPGGASGRRSA